MNDDIRIKKIRPEEEEAAAAAASGALPQNYTTTDYRDWQDTIDKLNKMNIQSTGNYAQDLELLKLAEVELERAIETQKTQHNRATENVTKLTDSDEDQAVKATFANGLTNELTANLKRFYHLGF